jgi:hypothetical protein
LKLLRPKITLPISSLSLIDNILITKHCSEDNLVLLMNHIVPICRRLSTLEINSTKPSLSTSIPQPTTSTLTSISTSSLPLSRMIWPHSLTDLTLTSFQEEEWIIPSDLSSLLRLSIQSSKLLTLNITNCRSTLHTLELISSHKRNDVPLVWDYGTSSPPPCIRHIRLKSLVETSVNGHQLLQQWGDILETIDLCISTALPSSSNTMALEEKTYVYHWPKCNRLILRGASITSWPNILINSSSIPSLQQLELEPWSDTPDLSDVLRYLAPWTNSSTSLSLPSIVLIHGTLDRMLLTMIEPFQTAMTTITDETSSPCSVRGIDHLHQDEKEACVINTLTRYSEWSNAIDTIIQPLSTLKSMHSLSPSNVHIHIPSHAKVLVSIFLLLYLSDVINA